MYIDSGRIKDLEMLTDKLRKTTVESEREKIRNAIASIKKQAEDLDLAHNREKLLNARRTSTNAVGEFNIKKARDEADKLEEKIVAENK